MRVLVVASLLMCLNGLSLADSLCSSTLEYFYLKKVEEVEHCGQIEESFQESEDGPSTTRYERKLTLPGSNFVLLYGVKGEIDGVTVYSDFLNTKWGLKVGDSLATLLKKIPDAEVLDTYHYARKNNYMFNFRDDKIFTQIRRREKNYKITDPEIQGLKIQSIFLLQGI